LVVQIENLNSCKVVGGKNLLKRRIFKDLKISSGLKKVGFWRRGRGDQRPPTLSLLPPLIDFLWALNLVLVNQQILF
jgi:hypothetical protein